MKKQLSIALASALAFGGVVPAFASEVSASESVDTRLANGKEIYENGKVFKRYEIFNYNGATAEETEKHTLKSEFKDLEVLVEQKDSTDANNDLFVLCKKSEDSVGVATNKAKYDALVSEINTLIADGYEMSRKTTSASITDGTTYNTGEEAVTLIKGEDSKTILFTNVDLLEATAQGNAEILRSEVFDLIINQIPTTSQTVTYDKETSKITLNFETLQNATTETKELYKITNLVKYTIENNLDKFDVVVDETGVSNADKLVKLYVKDSNKEATDLVMSIEFASFQNIDTDEIIDMPSLADTDFANHWAEDEIIDAMISGYVDATNNFRPKDSVTRAEFSKMVCTIFGIDTEDLTGKDEPFHDVDESAWYYKYVTALYNEGGKGVIINGYEDSTFKPQETITRQEAAKMIAQAMVVKGKSLNLLETADSTTGNVTLVTTTSSITKVEQTIVVNGEVINLDCETSFADDSEIKAWADASVANLKELGVVNGYEGNSFKPENEITRVEALLMLTRAQQK